jgi:5-methyltetrahydrofolate--homocysteine methyltransferase
MTDSVLKQIGEALIKGDRSAVSGLTEEALKGGLGVKKILDEGLIAAMETVGSRFKTNEIFIPEVLISAKAMQAGMKVLEPHLVKGGIKPIAKIAIGTVKGDLHDIGKNIVSMMLKGAGFEVEDFGIDVAPGVFADAVGGGGVQIVAMSSLLTTSMGSMKDTITLLEEKGMRGRVKVMVGGAPVTQAFADKIRADGYAKDAASAVDKAKELLGL